MNHSKTRMLTLAVAAAAVLGFSGTALAWHDGPGGRGPCGKGPGPAYQELRELDPAQRAAMQKLFEEFRAANDSTRQQLIVKEAELRAQMSAVQPNPQQIEKLSQELGALKGKMLAARAGLDAKLREAGLPAGCGWMADRDRGMSSDYGPGRGYHGRGSFHNERHGWNERGDASRIERY